MGATTKGRWSYACSKAIDEFLAIAYWKEKKLPTVVARLFNTVGPRQTGQYGMVVPNFVRQALAGQPITVYGDGKQSRCFTHVSDVVRALIGLMEHEDAYGQVFNIGNNVEISIADLAKQVREMCGSKSEIVSRPLREGLRGGLRGHAAPRAESQQDQERHRLAADHRAAADPRGCHRVSARDWLTGVTGAGFLGIRKGLRRRPWHLAVPDPGHAHAGAALQGS